MKQKINILSIDGDGVRGIIPAILLDDISKETNKKIIELFDFFAGTSTGALVTCALNVNKPNTNKPYTSSEVLALYQFQIYLTALQVCW